jgi:hypothetical protein
VRPTAPRQSRDLRWLKL